MIAFLYLIGIGIILYFLMDDEAMDLRDRIEYLTGGRPYNEPKDPAWPGP